MGGPGGHMWHPFDCPDVDSGKSLMDFFANSIGWLQKNPAALKIDGVNLSFRLRKNNNTSPGWEFVVDRGATSGAAGKLDQEGVTADNAHLRFVNKDDPSKPHGMVGATSTLLGILNSALPSLMPELEELGFLEEGGHGPLGMYFNTEFVLKKINVKEYPFNFIALHGIRQFTQKTERARGFKDVAVNQDILNKLRDKLHLHAIKNSPPFKVYTKIETHFKKKPNLERVLNTPIPINTGVDKNTKSLKQRLVEVDASPYGQKIILKEEVARKLGIPQAQDPFAKKIYMAVHSGTLIPEMVAHEDHVEPIVDAYAMQHAVRLVGNEILDVSHSEDFGSARDQEGIVIGPTSEICGGKVFKYTGDFIVGGLASSFKIHTSAVEEEAPENDEEESLSEEVSLMPDYREIADQEKDARLSRKFSKGVKGAKTSAKISRLQKKALGKNLSVGGTKHGTGLRYRKGNVEVTAGGGKKGGGATIGWRYEENLSRRGNGSGDILKEETELKNIALDVLGFIPGFGEIADFANVVDYAKKGDYLFSALSLISMVPEIGDIIGKGGKIGTWIGKNFPKASAAIIKYGPEVKKLKAAVATARPIIDSLFDKFEESEKIGEHVPKIKEALNAFMGEDSEGTDVVDNEEPTMDSSGDPLGKIQKVIAIYPGRFQPAGRHHAAAWTWLQTMFGVEETYLATSDVVKPPDSPFTFHEKQEILKAHGVPDEKIVQTKNPYQANEICNQFDSDTTAVVFMVGEKDMGDDPRFKNVDSNLKSGEPAYYKDFNKNKDNLEPLSKHGYLITAPHISLNVPGHGEMSGTSLRSFLKSAPQDQFSAVMGWFDQDLYNMIQSKLKMADSPAAESEEGQLNENFLSMGSLYSLVDEALHEKYKNVFGLNEVISLVDEAILEKKTKKRVSRKIAHLIDKEGKPRDQAVAMAHSMEEQGKLAEYNINETFEEELSTNIKACIAKLLSGNIRNMDADKLADIGGPLADDWTEQLMATLETAQEEKSPGAEPEEVAGRMEEVSGAGGVAGYAGPFGNKKRKQELAR